jgi:SAM-dependent methyltransferase/glycosyltransferase involved in cell wall biosynthesis
MRTALYICYFGSEQPLVHTQVLPYLRRIAESGVKIHLLTYETVTPSEPGHRAAMEAGGINWHRLKYHKRPSLIATGFDVLLGVFYSVLLVLWHRVDVVHARSHVAGAIGLALKRIFRLKLIFDFRGLMAEEYVDNGVWAENSLPFRLVKWAERALIKRADRVVVLTKKLESMLTGAGAPTSVSVIPCCIDLSKYPKREGTEPRSRVTLAYAGSATGRYMLREMAAFFKALWDRLNGRAHFLVITKTAQPAIEAALAEEGIDPACYSVTAATPDEVPALLCSADIGISFIRPSPALAGATPTKIGEYLAAGLPVISSIGVGDTDEILRAEKVGTTIANFDRAAYERALGNLLVLLKSADVRARCRAVADKFYSLENIGGPRYVELYRSLENASARDDGSTLAGELSPHFRCPVCRSSVFSYIGKARDGTRLERCRACGLACHNGFSSRSDIGDYYGHYYHEDNLTFSPISETRFRSLLASFEPYRRSGRILDVGCGAGHLLKVAMERGWSAYGTEIAAGAFDQLARLGITAFRGELQSAGYPDGFFDVVFCSEVIEHLLDPVSLLDESARILRPGGLIYLTTPNFNSLSRRLLGLDWRVFGKEHVCYFTPHALGRLASNAGFSRVKIRTRNIDPYELRRVLRGGLGAPNGGFDAARTEELRERLGKPGVLRFAKLLTNVFLSTTSLGDTICMSANR